MHFPRLPFSRRRDRELDEEIRSHLSMASRDHVDRGQSPQQARLSAQREFGSVALVKEVTRSTWGWSLLERFAQDLRYAFCQLRSSAAFTASAVLTLALGIGANSAIFSVVNGVLLNPLPYPNSDRLMWIWGRTPGGVATAAISPPNYRDYRAGNRTFEHFGAFSPFVGVRNWSLNGEARQLRSAMVTGDFFDALGYPPLLGRNFTRDDEQTNAPRAAILSYRVWQQAYGGDPNIVGLTARMDSSPMTIVGVMPASFDFPRNTDFWFPTPMLARGLQQRMGHNLRGVGLLKPGVSMARAQADLNAIAARLGEQYPADKGWQLLLQPLRDAIVGPVRPVLMMLLGAVALVLLIACVNVANLLLARYGSRRREISIRTAIGAGRARIVRQLVTENLLLAFFAGALALALAYWGVDLLRTYGPQSLPRLKEVRLDGHVLAFTAMISALTALVFGLGPAWLATAVAPAARLREDGRTGSGRRRHILGAVLVISETALSLCLLIGAGLLLESFSKTLHAPPGFSPDGVLSTELLLPAATYRDIPSRVQFLQRLTEGIRALPGVQSAGGISEMPLSGDQNDTLFRILEHPDSDPKRVKDAEFRVVTPGYFSALRIPLLRGSLFDEQYRPSSQRVVMIDESFARQFFPGEDPIGKHLSIYSGAAGYLTREIIGVAGGVRSFSLQIPPQPTMYFPFTQAEPDHLHLFVRSDADPRSLADPIRRIVAGQDRDVALATFQTLDRFVSESVAGNRFDTILLGLFAALALVLAMAGVYGVLSYIVAQQTHEIGVRMALGAHPARMLRLVLGRGVCLAAIGAGLGSVAAFFLVRVLATQLYDVKPRDPAIFAIAAALLIAVAVAACALPARRAMRVDPLVALRYE